MGCMLRGRRGRCLRPLNTVETGCGDCLHWPEQLPEDRQSGELCALLPVLRGPSVPHAVP